MYTNEGEGDADEHEAVCSGVEKSLIAGSCGNNREIDGDQHNGECGSDDETHC